jgi:outer membrane biosynthesis protein TonB
MKLKQLMYLGLMVALATPMLVDAQIYKWKDKNGVTRYSDTPPTDNVKVDKIGKEKTTKPAPAAEKEANPAANNKTQPDSEDEAAQLRARNAEIEKKNKEEKAAQAKLKAENCRSAKADYETFIQGGRIYQMNEKGEREYFDDAALNERKAQAQAQANMQQYCN